jgi:hypothetical protein
MVVVATYQMLVEGIERAGSHKLFERFESFYKSTIGLGFSNTTFDLSELGFEE